MLLEINMQYLFNITDQMITGLYRYAVRIWADVQFNRKSRIVY